MGHDTESTERNNRATKSVSIDFPSQFNELPVGNDKLYRGD